MALTMLRLHPRRSEHRPQAAPARLYGTTSRHHRPQNDDLTDVADDENDGEEVAA